MKTINKFFAALTMLSISATGFAQASQTPDSLGLPGDNLNLYGVLALFKESKTVEEFEQKLNTPDNKVNNLDLNHDGQTDMRNISVTIRHRLNAHLHQTDDRHERPDKPKPAHQAKRIPPPVPPEKHRQPGSSPAPAIAPRATESAA